MICGLFLVLFLFFFLIYFLGEESKGKDGV